MVRLLCQFGVFFRPENDLHEPFPIAQIDKNDATMIAHDMNPTGENGGRADIFLAQLVAMMGPVHARSL